MSLRSRDLFGRVTGNRNGVGSSGPAGGSGSASGNGCGLGSASLQQAPSTPVTPLDPLQAAAARAGTGLQFDGGCAYTPAMIRLEFATVSECGRVHPRNEDAHSPPALAGRLFVVADGVGGGAMARVVSRQLVRRLHRALNPQRIGAAEITRAVLEADRAIAGHVARRSERPGAATLVLCAPVDAQASKWLVGWVGDCRAYRIAPGHGERDAQLTRDDTFRLLAEQPPPGSTPDDPARMVGNGATLGANVAAFTLAAGELLALCSDGVHKFVEPAAFAAALSAPGPLARRAQALIAQARRNGSTDDATLMLVRHGGYGLPVRAAAPQNPQEPLR